MPARGIGATSAQVDSRVSQEEAGYRRPDAKRGAVGFRERTRVPVGIHQASFVRNRGASSGRPDLVIPGEIRFGRGHPPAVRGLRASVEGDVRLSWQNAFDYEKIAIERNGAPAGETTGRPPC